MTKHITFKDANRYYWLIELNYPENKSNFIRPKTSVTVNLFRSMIDYHDPEKTLIYSTEIEEKDINACDILKDFSMYINSVIVEMAATLKMQ